MIWGGELHDRLPQKILHFGEINKLYFGPFFKSKFIRYRPK